MARQGAGHIRAHQRHTFLKITVDTCLDIPPSHNLLQKMKLNKRMANTCYVEMMHIAIMWLQ